MVGDEKRDFGIQFTQKLKARNPCKIVKNEDESHTMVDV